jgi:hypothetical protein
VAWAALALELGYHDQAHLIRDFKAQVGFTPAAYAERCAASLPGRSSARDRGQRVRGGVARVDAGAVGFLGDGDDTAAGRGGGEERIGGP